MEIINYKEIEDYLKDILKEYKVSYRLYLYENNPQRKRRKEVNSLKLKAHYYREKYDLTLQSNILHLN
jgi:hypothetical protein